MDTKGKHMDIVDKLDKNDFITWLGSQNFYWISKDHFKGELEDKLETKFFSEGNTTRYNSVDALNELEAPCLGSGASKCTRSKIEIMFIRYLFTLDIKSNIDNF